MKTVNDASLSDCQLFLYQSGRREFSDLNSDSWNSFPFSSSAEVRTRSFSRCERECEMKIDLECVIVVVAQEKNRKQSEKHELKFIIQRAMLTGFALAGDWMSTLNSIKFYNSWNEKKCCYWAPRRFILFWARPSRLSLRLSGKEEEKIERKEWNSHLCKHTAHRGAKLWEYRAEPPWCSLQ